MLLDLYFEDYVVPPSLTAVGVRLTPVQLESATVSSDIAATRIQVITPDLIARPPGGEPRDG